MSLCTRKLTANKNEKKKIYTGHSMAKSYSNFFFSITESPRRSRKVGVLKRFNPIFTRGVTIGFEIVTKLKKKK